MSQSITRPARHRLLTKSLFLKGCECPRKLKYALNPQKYPQSEKNTFLSNLADEGQKVEAYSRLLFPNGIFIDEHRSRAKSSDDFEEMAEKTRSLLMEAGDEEVTLFQGVAKAGSCLVQADILHKPPDSSEIRVMEVKARSWDSRKGIDHLFTRNGQSIRASYLPHVRDVAFQRLVLQQQYKDSVPISAWLILPDKAKVNTHIHRLNQLFQPQRTSAMLGPVTKDEKELLELGEYDVVDDAARELILQKCPEPSDFLVTQINVDLAVDKMLEEVLEVPGTLGQPAVSFRETVHIWAQQVAGEQHTDDNHQAAAPPPPLGHQCRFCEFRVSVDSADQPQVSGFDECWSEALASRSGNQPRAPRHPIVDLWSGTPKQTELYLAARKFNLQDLSSSPTNLGLKPDGSDPTAKKTHVGMTRRQRQWYQVNATNEDAAAPLVIMDRELMQSAVDSWSYPWNFLDFETVSPSLPYAVGKAPYDVLAFQFSLHKVLNQDDMAKHANEFLHAVPGESPNVMFLEALAEALQKDGGTVFHWGLHEKTVLTALLNDETLSDSSRDVLEALLAETDSSRMVDLSRLANQAYFVTGSDGSSSIKRLLLPTMHASARLQDRYGQPNYTSKNFTDMQWCQGTEEDGNGKSHHLKDPFLLLSPLSSGTNVAEGGDAAAAYGLLQQEQTDDKTRAAVEASLLRYCELDTLAMAMIVQAWQGFLSEDDRFSQHG